MSRPYSDPTSPDRKAVAVGLEPVTVAFVGRELKRLRREAGETQAQTAAIVGVARANLAQWETGKHLPSPQNARQLDTHFGTANALVELVEAARSPRDWERPVITPTVVTSDSLGSVFLRVGRSLAHHLVTGEDGRPIGWRHNLQQSKHPTALSTAYGLSAMVLVGEPYIDLQALAESLLSMRAHDGGWQGRSGSPRPEITAAVIDALFRVGTSMPVDQALNLIADSFVPDSAARPYLLSTTVHTVARLRPDGALADRLVDELLAARLDFPGKGKLWPEKNEPGLVAPEASVAHTARAVCALNDFRRRRDDRPEVEDAVEEAVRWLVSRQHPDDGVYEELIRPRPDGNGTTRVLIRHFTAAWVSQALATSPHFPLARMQKALDVLWKRYDRDNGLWAWGSGDLPIWMTLDAVAALREAAYATSALGPPGMRNQG
ncbi:helix-turn-helix domain-containing protein [Amycolatopsis alkalitolerans]|uniref:Helix-turn-helix domain-containing protein n=1 Tax=Amycolatopsis alkalitolerans TaxID=2547244 RepID=A0A5C4M065_9PSEU|nr:helix-turn-helix domain-containing protein [Amycolatopsis alkalitolerans]TNC22926.1 helix-turn-helix domain-containing protein [Amycolatopsis alkalitolerans]